MIKKININSELVSIISVMSDIKSIINLNKKLLYKTKIEIVILDGNIEVFSLELKEDK